MLGIVRFSCAFLLIGIWPAVSEPADLRPRYHVAYSDSASVPDDDRISHTFNLPQFDPEIGELRSVDLHLVASGRSAQYYDTAHYCPSTLTASGILTFVRAMLEGRTLFDDADPQPDASFWGDRTWLVDVYLAGTGVYTATDAEELHAFVGTGQLAYECAASIGYQVTIKTSPDCRLRLASRLLNAELTATITYTYVLPDHVPPVLTRAVSRKTHGSAGVFDLDLPVDSEDSGVECRAGGPTLLVLTFSEPVVAADGLLDDSEVALSGGILGYAFATENQVILNLAGVPDATCVSVALSGLVDLAENPLAGPDGLHLRALTGDVNSDGVVASADITQLKTRSGQNTDAANFRFDVNADGLIASADITQVKARSGNAADCR